MDIRDDELRMEDDEDRGGGDEGAVDVWDWEEIGGVYSRPK